MRENTDTSKYPKRFALYVSLFTMNKRIPHSLRLCNHPHQSYPASYYCVWWNLCWCVWEFILFGISISYLCKGLSFSVGFLKFKHLTSCNWNKHPTIDDPFSLLIWLHPTQAQFKVETFQYVNMIGSTGETYGYYSQKKLFWVLVWSVTAT